MTIRIHFSRLMGERKQKIADVQRATGLARNTLSGLYKENVARVDLETLDKLCRHFGCTSSTEIIEYVPDVEDKAEGGVGIAPVAAETAPTN